MNPEYHIRIDTDLPDQKITQFFSDLKLYGEPQFTKYLVCREAKADGTIHIHACVGLVVSRNTIRDRIRKYFTIEKTSDYSISKRRKPSLESYILKDGHVIVSSGYTDEEIDKYRKDSFQKSKKSKVKSSTMMGSLVQGMMDFWKDPNPPNPRDYAKFIYHYYVKELRIMPSDFKMKDMAFTLELLYSQEKYGYNRLDQLIDLKVESLYSGEYFRY